MSDTAAATPMRLLDLLDEELRCCRRMVALAKAQRDAMLAGDVAALAPAVREMEGLAAALARLEEERAAYGAEDLHPPVSAACCPSPRPAATPRPAVEMGTRTQQPRPPVEHGAPACRDGASLPRQGRGARGRAVSLTGVLQSGAEGRGEAQAEADQARLEELRADLRATLVELRALNNANAALARRALTATEQTLRLLQAALPATYEANGALHPGRAGVRQTWTV
jgi:hypothetical protein